MPAFSPTHSVDEIWTIVAFVRHLPELTPEEQQLLKAGSAGEEHHHKEQKGKGAVGSYVHGDRPDKDLDR